VKTRLHEIPLHIRINRHPFASSEWALPPAAPIFVQFFMAGATAQKSTLPNVLGGAATQTGYAFDYRACHPSSSFGCVSRRAAFVLGNGPHLVVGRFVVAAVSIASTTHLVFAFPAS
jgi:hypothetical protein